MLSLRSLARSVPRSLTCLAAQSARRPAVVARSSLLSQAAWRRTPAVRPIAAFHTSRARFAEADDAGVNEELVAKLSQELSLEKDARDPEALSGSIQEYLEDTPFELVDTPGQEEAHLIRQFGDETVKVTFTITDLGMNQDEEDPDKALFDEEDPAGLGADGQSGGATTKGAVNQGAGGDGNVRVAPEDRVAPADRPELADEQPQPASADDAQDESFPCRLKVTVSKPGRGALVVDAMTHDGEIVINDLAYFATKELAEAASMEKDFERRTAYKGPPFGNLDEDLQILTERYLEERGVNTSMALFIPDYIDFKEQREYVDWLENVKKFVE